MGSAINKTYMLQCFHGLSLLPGLRFYDCRMLTFPDDH